jgi:desulfoferrodoxin-like iron-binding protein
MFKCEICGKTVNIVKDGEGILVCCDEPMVSYEMTSIESILEFAIDKEQEASDFYKDMSAKINRPEISKVLDSFAAEEMKHKARLLDVKAGNMDKFYKPSQDKVTDLKITDYLVDIPVKPDMNYQEALILAMKREKSAYRLYSDLSNMTSDEPTKDLFLSLAQEEAKHKLRLEMEYDENILTWN